MEVDEQRKSSYSTEGKIKLLCLGLRVDCKGLFSMFQLRDTDYILRYHIFCDSFLSQHFLVVCDVCSVLSTCRLYF